MTEQSVHPFQKAFEGTRATAVTIKKEVKGDLENAFQNLVHGIQNKPLSFAD